MESSSRQEFPVPLPCLVVDHDGPGGEPCTTLLDISNGEYQYRSGNNIDVLPNRQRWVTPDGWVLSWDPSTLSTFLRSPQTSEKIPLPSLARKKHKYSACSLSDKPSNNAGFTVVVAEPDDAVMWYCHVGGMAAASCGWVRHEYYLGIIRVPVMSGSMPVDRVMNWMATSGGRFYFVKSGAELGVLEFSPNKPVITSVVVPSVNRPAGTTYTAASCVELDGEIYLVSAFLRYDGVDLSLLGSGVYRMDFAATRWRMVHSIGDRAFLMGPNHFGAWCAATGSGLRPNCVYWMGLLDDNRMHVFNIGMGTYEVHDPCKDIAGANAKAIWMLPTDP